MKKNVAVVIIMVMLFSLVGCANASTCRDRDYTEEIKSQFAETIGYPDMTNGFEYSQLKEIYELRDDPNLICYWYTKCDMTGKWIYEGKCAGYGIPYSASVTSPDTLAYDGGSAVVSQAEPNGIYTNGLSTSATFILAIGAEGEIKPEYVEQEIRVSQNKIRREICEEWSLPDDY